MVLDKFEYTKIRNMKLPSSWKPQSALDELNEFLQQNWEQRFVFYKDKEIESKQQFVDFLGFGDIKTKNYIGTIVFKGEQLNIYPKIFSTDKNDYDCDDLSPNHMIYNIVKWIEYSNKIDYPFINISSKLTDSKDFKELFITLYIGYVRSALEGRYYYQYVEKINDCTKIKGKFDFKDYLTIKIPNRQIDKFKCIYSDFEFDNKLNRIIKYTCKQLINITSKINQKKIRIILIMLNEISDEQCYPSDCDNIRLSKLNRHYEIIISMSKMFLLNKTSNYSINTNESFCFLFPTYLLFEGFIGGFLSEVICEKGGKVFLQESSVSLIENIIYKGNKSGPKFTMRHDILVEFNNIVFILDTKYKEISRFEDSLDFEKNINKEIKQSDLYQVLEYARKRNIEDVYLVYPMYRYEEREKDFPIAISKSPSGDINIHFIRLPFVFEKDNEENITLQLTEVIKSIFIINY